MTEITDNAPRGKRRLLFPLLVFLMLSIFMYGSIMYKIIHYGP
jgi:hypothetical protein